MINRIEIKRTAKETIKGKLGVILKPLIVMATSALIIVLMGNLLNYFIHDSFSLELPTRVTFITNVVLFVTETFFTAGFIKYMFHFLRNETPKIEDLWKSKNLFLPVLAMTIMISIYTTLWTLLLIIPGIIAGLSYSMAYYIIVDNTNITFIEAIKQSKKMMKGHKLEFLLFQLSFIGWTLLTAITCGIAYVWVGPYITTATFLYYEKLKTLQTKELG